MKMQEALTGKFMVFSFFINCWIAVASSHSREVLAMSVRAVTTAHPHLGLAWLKN